MSTLTPSPEELLSLYADLFMTGKPVLLSLLPEFCESHVPLCMRGIIPTPLTDLFNESYLDLSYPNLLNKCDEVYSSYSISPEQAKSIEKETRV